jgi:Uma2 family endonuclease
VRYHHSGKREEHVTDVKVRIGPGDHGRTMSLEEFADAGGEPGHSYELAAGVVHVVEVPGLPHGLILWELDRQLHAWAALHPGVLRYQASGDRCAIRLPGVQTERHPDVALYLTPSPDPVSPWDRWIPEIVVEVVSPSSATRDYGEKPRDYLAAGVKEYWIVDPIKCVVVVLQRAGDVFREQKTSDSYTTPLLPGFALDVSRLLAAGEGTP